MRVLRFLAVVTALVASASASANDLQSAMNAAPEIKCETKNTHGEWCFAVFRYTDGTEVEVVLQRGKDGKFNSGWKLKPRSVQGSVMPR